MAIKKVAAPRKKPAAAKKAGRTPKKIDVEAEWAAFDDATKEWLVDAGLTIDNPVDQVLLDIEDEMFTYEDLVRILSAIGNYFVEGGAAAKAERAAKAKRAAKKVRAARKAPAKRA